MEEADDSRRLVLGKGTHGVVYAARNKDNQVWRSKGLLGDVVNMREDAQWAKTV